MNEKLKINPSADLLLKRAFAFAKANKSEFIRHIDLMYCIVHFNQDIVCELLGRKLLLDEDIVACIEKTTQDIGSLEECRIQTELSHVFLDESKGSALERWKKIFFTSTLDIYAITFSLLYNMNEDIANFLLRNNFPNDLSIIDNIITKNFYSGSYIRNPLGEQKESLEPMLNAKLKNIEEYLISKMPDKEDAIYNFASGLSLLWTKGNDAKAYVCLLVSKSDSQIKSFLENSVKSFVSENLQYATGNECFDLSNLSGEAQADRIVLLGSSPSYKSASSGMFYDLSETSPSGIIALEHLERANKNTFTLLKSFLSNEAVDAYHEKKIHIVKNVIILTLKIDEDAYSYLSKDGNNDIFELTDDEVVNALKQSNKEDLAYQLSTLGNSINKVIFLADAKEDVFYEIIDDYLVKFAENISASLDCNLEKFRKIIMESFPKTPYTEEVENALKKIFSKIKPLNLSKIKINIEDFEPYAFSEEKRKSREEYLSWDFDYDLSGDVLNINFKNLSYKRLSHKKEIDVSKVYFSDVVGWENQIEELKCAMDFITKPEKYLNCPKPPRNFLLSGPPGVGKTYLVQAVATEAGGWPVFEYSATNSASVYDLEEIFKQAQKTAPSIIIIDEIDVMAYDQQQSLLRILDGTQKLDKIMVFATTNRVFDLNEALLRNGRFSSMAFYLPDNSQREAFLVKYLNKWKEDISASQIDDIVEITVGMNTADIEGLLNTSLRYARLNNQKLSIDVLKRQKSLGAKNIGFN